MQNPTCLETAQCWGGMTITSQGLDYRLEGLWFRDTVDGWYDARPRVFNSTIVPGGFWYLASRRISSISL